MFFNIVTPAYAQCVPGLGGIDLGDCIKNNEGQPIKDIYDRPSVLVNVLVENLFVAAGVILLFIILYAGFLMVTKGKQGFEDARKIFTGALTGFLLMFSAYWIVQIISLLTGAEFLIL